MPEVNCNGHVEVDQRQPQWRDEDQHNGNAEPTEKHTSQEEQHKGSPVHTICNGVDAADLKELDGNTEGRGAHSSGVTERRLSGLEDEELERSILREEREDCQYSAEDNLRDGQSDKISTPDSCLEVL